MTIALDIQYINQIGYRLESFSWKRDQVAQSRCPICMDSQKSKRKKRFNFFKGKDGADSMFVMCFNCGYSNSFRNFLSQQFPDVYSDYVRASYMANHTVKPIKQAPVDYRTNLVHRFSSMTTNSVRSDVYCEPLSSDIGCLNYILQRKIPEQFHKELWVSNNFKKTIEAFNYEVSLSIPPNEKRLVIPYFNEEKELIALQGRSLDKNNSRKYMLIKQSEDCPKFFGLDRVDVSKTVYVVEGAFDSMFLDNCVSTNDLNLLKWQSQDAVYLVDRQYRNSDVVRTCYNIIEAGKKIVLFPKTIVGKDINEMVLAGINIKEVIQKNTFQGLRAKLVLQSLKGI